MAHDWVHDAKSVGWVARISDSSRSSDSLEHVDRFLATGNLGAFHSFALSYKGRFVAIADEGRGIAIWRIPNWEDKVVLDAPAY